MADPLSPHSTSQALLALYFFLAGMLVKGHPYMWLLPCVSCACAMGIHAVHAASRLVVAPYRCVCACTGGLRLFCASVLVSACVLGMPQYVRCPCVLCTCV